MRRSNQGVARRSRALLLLLCLLDLHLAELLLLPLLLRLLVRLKEVVEVAEVHAHVPASLERCIFGVRQPQVRSAHAANSETATPRRQRSPAGCVS